MPQARGYKEVLLFLLESTYGTTPSVTPGDMVKLPFNSQDLRSRQNQINPETITGNRSQVQPARGHISVEGGLTVPLDVRAIGHWLKLLCGEPTTAQLLTGLDVDTIVWQSGTTVRYTFNGTPTLSAVTAGMKLVVASAANAANNGTFLISAVNDGADWIEVTNAARTSSSGDEASDAPATAGVGYYTHTYKMSDTVPSATLESGFASPAHYSLFKGCKVDSLAMSIGGDAEMTAQISVMGASETVGTSSADSSPSSLSFDRFNNFQATVQEGGSSIAILTGFDFDIRNNLEKNYTIGNSGNLTSLEEGALECSGSIRALFQDQTLYNKAINGTESSLKVTFTNGVYILEILFPELNFERSGLSRNGPAGVLVDLPFRAFYENSSEASSFQIILKNDINNY